MSKMRCNGFKIFQDQLLSTATVCLNDPEFVAPNTKPHLGHFVLPPSECESPGLNETTSSCTNCGSNPHLMRHSPNSLPRVKPHKSARLSKVWMFDLSAGKCWKCWKCWKCCTSLKSSTATFLHHPTPKQVRWASAYAVPFHHGASSRSCWPAAGRLWQGPNKHRNVHLFAACLTCHR